MFAYCNNNPVCWSDPTGFFLKGILNTFIDTFAEAIKSVSGVFAFAGAVTQLDSPVPGPADVVGAAISAVAVATCVAVSTYAIAKEVSEEIDVKVYIAESSQDDSVYYGADMYGGTWKTVTPPMNQAEAKIWVGTTAASHVYGKNASWGLYTSNRDDALQMATTLGGVGPHLHCGNRGQYDHYHVLGMVLFGEYKHFHIWYGTIWGE